MKLMTSDKARLTFLGTGTSQGVPIIGCQCGVCRSNDPKDKRFRSSALIEYGGLTILVDAGPDFRSQMLRQGVRHLDAVLLTHNHKDHTGGLDDLRSLNYTDRRSADIYCEQNVLEDLVREYPYVFSFPKYPGAPEWRIHVIDENPFLAYSSKDAMELVWVRGQGYRFLHPDGSMVSTGDCIDDVVDKADPASMEHSTGGVKIIPVRGMHGNLPVLGFRFGDIAYLTDMKTVPESEFEKLKGLKHLTLNTVGYNPHHSHFSFEETLEMAERIGAEHTWLTHLSHTFPSHEAFCEEIDRACAAKGIRADIHPAFDGLTIE